MTDPPESSTPPTPLDGGCPALSKGGGPTARGHNSVLPSPAPGRDGAPPDGALPPEETEFFHQMTSAVTEGRSRTSDQAARMMGSIMTGLVPEQSLAAYLTALADKGESIDEIVGSAQALRDRAVPFPTPCDVLDTCGTGGDGAGTFNISTVAALVVAAAGQHVAKHGNRSASGRVGSADLLEAMGAKIDVDPATAVEHLRRNHFAFLYAPRYHPAAAHAAAVRRRLGRPTIFNLIGPLCNPARPAYQVLGVCNEAIAIKMAEALRRLQVRRAFVVTGPGGIDELVPADGNQVIAISGGQMVRHSLSAADAGLPPCTIEQLQGGDVATNAAITRRVLSGEHGPPLDTVVMNAGLALVASGLADSLREGCARALHAVESGAAADLLKRICQHAEPKPGAMPEPGAMPKRSAGMPSTDGEDS